MDKKIIKIAEIILVSSIILLCGLLSYDYIDKKRTEKYAEGLVGEINKIIEDNKDIDKDALYVVNEENTSVSNNEEVVKATVVQPQVKQIEISGVNVFGKIKIDKIAIEYPIIEYKNEDSLWTSICKVSANNIDGTGNLCLAGHNMRNLTMFGNLRKVQNGDKIEITDLKGKIFNYIVYDKFFIKPDETYIMDETDESIITLITCNDSLDRRMIVRGKLQ